MNRIIAYPLMMASLVVMWLLRISFSPGQLLMGVVVRSSLSKVWPRRIRPSRACVAGI